MVILRKAQLVSRCSCKFSRSLVVRSALYFCVLRRALGFQWAVLLTHHMHKSACHLLCQWGRQQSTCTNCLQYLSQLVSQCASTLLTSHLLNEIHDMAQYVQHPCTADTVLVQGC